MASNLVYLRDETKGQHSSRRRSRRAQKSAPPAANHPRARRAMPRFLGSPPATPC
jgi:hypothetical protein